MSSLYARLDLERIIDYVRGGESDTGGYTSVPCPACKGTHYTSASRLGWFVYQCKDTVVFGKICGWPAGAINLRSAAREN